MGFYKSIKKYIIDRCGSILPLTALTLPLVIGMTGFGVDVSMWMMNKRDLQSAADSAAIAAAWEVANNYDDIDLFEISIEEDIDSNYDSYPEYAAYKEAMNNGFDPSNGNLSIEFGKDENGLDRITVSISQEEDLYFSFAVFQKDVYTSAAAATVVIVPTGDYCMLALDNISDSAIGASGNVEVIADACGIAVNSDSESAIDLSGSVTIDVKDISIVGDIDAGGGVDLEYETLETGASPIPDPYKNLDTPEYDEDNCSPDSGKINASKTIYPGVYCGGIKVTKSSINIEMAAGVYIMECGDFDVNGGDVISEDEGVSIIFTCADDVNDTGGMKLNGNGDIDLSAPLPGSLDEEFADYEGVLMYKDRDAPELSQCNIVNGGASVLLDGAVYFPSDCFKISGNADMISPGANPCTRLIAKTIQLSGSPYLANGCDGSAAKDIGEYNIKLVL